MERVYPRGKNTILNTSAKKSKSGAWRDAWKDDYLFLGETPGSQIYIYNTYTVREKGRKIKKLQFQDREQAVACLTLLCDICVKYGFSEEDEYRVSGDLFPDEIRERLVVDNSCMFAGKLLSLEDGSEDVSGEFARPILLALRGEGKGLKYAWFNKLSIEFLSACLQYWSQAIVDDTENGLVTPREDIMRSLKQKYKDYMSIFER